VYAGILNQKLANVLSANFSAEGKSQFSIIFVSQILPDDFIVNEHNKFIIETKSVLHKRITELEEKDYSLVCCGLTWISILGVISIHDCARVIKAIDEIMPTELIEYIDSNKGVVNSLLTGLLEYLKAIEDICVEKEVCRPLKKKMNNNSACVTSSSWHEKVIKVVSLAKDLLTEIDKNDKTQLIKLQILFKIIFQKNIENGELAAYDELFENDFQVKIKGCQRLYST